MGTRDAGVMSGVKLVCALTAGVFLLSACGKTEEKDGSSVPMESDAMEADLEYPFVAESEDGYYFWERMGEEQSYPRLMFMDKESGRVVPLCNKPDCAHDSEECNARFPDLNFGEDGIYKDYLQYYEGSLYAVGLSSDYYVTLFRIKADGSEWEISTKLYRTEYASTGHWRTPDLLLAEDYVYFNDHMQKKMKLERMPLGGGTSEVLFEGEDDAVEVQTYRLKESGGFVFFQALVFSGDNYENVAGGLYRYDAAAGQCSLLKSGLIGPYTVWNGAVYYANTEGLCRYSIQEGTTEIRTDQPMGVP
ncbi:MAG: hypothetical protein NC254_13985, partial [bacterium]|nr:hypothetical protein [bacterium]